MHKHTHTWTHISTYLPTFRGQIGIAANEPMHVKNRLAVSGEIDGARHDVQVHQKRDDFRGQKPVNVVQVQLTPGIVDFGVTAFGFLWGENE